MKEEKPQKDTDRLNKEQIALYRVIKWANYMAQSCKRARTETKKRNLARPEFASKEVLGVFEGQEKAYNTMVQRLIKDLNLLSLEEILKLSI